MGYLLSHVLTESAAKWPAKEAVRWNGDALTYEELDRATNQIARALRDAGVRRGDRVGIYLHKSFGSLLAVFGILKAGAVYVPLDPSAPAKRLAYITRNCDIRVVLMASEKIPSLFRFYEEKTPIRTALLLDSGTAESAEDCEIVPWSRIEALDGGPLEDTGGIETDLAYILYTSGSTGEPKGVMISHRTIYTFLDWCHETFGMSEEDRVTSHAPLHFDLSTFDLFVTIKAGGTVVLVPEKLSVFPERLVALLARERVTVTYLVPSILSLMVNYGKLGGHDLSALRTILFAGEVFPIKYLRQLVAAVPAVDYYNLYGPTETNVCTYYKVMPDDLAPDRTKPVPIGRACGNIEVFAVDDEGELVTAPGREGELWVRGSCVAQGYWGDPEKTAKGFVPNTFQPHFHETAYRTGDLVTLSEDGENWIYHGRRDHMIKSRGYRIELGDIEAALTHHERVKEAAVVAIPDELLGNRIRAVVALDGNGVSVKELEMHCARHMPRYMVPETIEFRETLPKTSTGKINRPQLVREMTHG